MKAKTLTHHLCGAWPDLKPVDAITLTDEGLSSRHRELLRKEGGIQNELLLFRKEGITLQLLKETVESFLRENGMEVTSPPHANLFLRDAAEAAHIQQTEYRMLGLYGKSEKTRQGFKQMGEVYYLVYYQEIGLIIIYSHSGELRWSPR